ncbi:MAG: EF-hand domain-containing protein, partial [Candidatus Gastranaerophilales bacterium]|nr:EF-hand domain-containing protein [Candidatus Gastranaerophilales bacterium]
MNEHIEKLFKEIDKDNNGYISLQEQEDALAEMDTNGDGKITRDEFFNRNSSLKEAKSAKNEDSSSDPDLDF